MSPPDPWQAKTTEPAPKPTWRQRFVRLVPLLSVMTFALIVRGGVLLAMGKNLEADPDGYRRIAELLLQSGIYAHPHTEKLAMYDKQQDDRRRFTPLILPVVGKPRESAYRPPFYPIVLSKVAINGQVTPVIVGALHLGMGLLTVWLVYLCAQRLGLGRWGLAAALLVICDPILLQQSSLVMTETLATFLAALALYCLSVLASGRRPLWAAYAGGSIALAVLCRPTFLPWLVLSLPFVLAIGQTWSRRLSNLAAFGVTAIAVLTPWTVRNAIYLGKPIVTTTHGGYTFALANNPWLYQHLREGGSLGTWNSHDFDTGESLPNAYDWNWSEPVVTLLIPHESYDNFEILVDRHYYREAIRTIRREPDIFAYSCLLRVGQLWSPLPHRSLSGNETHDSTLLRYCVAVWYIGVYVLALVGVAKLRWRILQTPWVWGVLLALSFTLVHTFYWTNLRMRAPLMPVVCLLAAAGAGYLWDVLMRRKRLPHSELTPAG